MFFPGIFLGIACVVALTSLWAVDSDVQARAIPVTGSTREVANSFPVDGQIEKISPQSKSKNVCQLPTRYPQSIRQWCDLIESEAEKNGIDPRLVAAVMLQESGGNAKAYSKSGAVGLMQVMPRDGIAAGFQCKNGPCFTARPSVAELYDPAFNIEYGTRMLAGLIKKHGSIREALRAYGPMDMGYGYADKVMTIFSNYK